MTMKGKSQSCGIEDTIETTELGRFIRARRKEKNLSQTLLASMAGLGRSQVSLLELGHVTCLKEKHLTGLSRALGCRPEELFERLPEKKRRQPTTELGKIIRSRREALGMSIQDLAEKLGLREGEVRHIENRKYPHIRHDLARQLAGALSLEPAVLGGFLGTGKSKVTVSAMGQVIRERCNALMISSAELARRLGVSRAFVSQIELGQCPLSEDTALVRRIARALKLEPAELEVLRPRRRQRENTKASSPLGSFLAHCRRDLRLTQAQVAQRVGTNIANIQYAERNAKNLGTCERIARALNCEIPAELLVENAQKGEECV